MAKGLSENQMLLAEYLTVVGCNARTMFKIIREVWKEDNVIQMLEYCRDNPEASPAQLSGMSSIISSKNKEM